MLLTGIMTVSAESILGDADSDNDVTIMDVTCIQRKLAGLKIPDGFSETAADADGNGVTEIIDATYIQRWKAGMETPYPIGVRPEAPTQASTDAEGWGNDIIRP